VNVILRINDDECCATLGKKNLFGMTHHYDIAINADFEWAKRPFVQGRVQIGEFHGWKLSAKV